MDIFLCSWVFRIDLVAVPFNVVDDIITVACRYVVSCGGEYVMQLSQCGRVSMKML